MKTLKTLFAFFLLAVVVGACKEELVKATLKTDVAPNELQALSSDSYVLVTGDKANVMETFKWSATDFGFPASVTYTLQIDKKDNAFASPQDVVSTNKLEVAVTVGAFNDLLLALGLTPEQAADIDIRVKSVIRTDVPPVYSNTRSVSVTDYATSFLPLYGMGDGLKGWTSAWPAEEVLWPSSEYKKYSTIAFLTNGGAFRWFAQENWGPTSYNYDYFTGGVTNVLINALDGDHNLKVDGATGWYKIDVDLTARTVVVTASEEPQLWLMGAGINGWGPWPDKGVKMDYISPGVFTVTANFAVADEAWRFFAQPDWGPTAYNYTYFSSVPNNFINAADNDTNFRNVGTPGALKIFVDLNLKTFTLEPVLFMMGGGLNGWGPWHDKEIVMTWMGGNKFDATTTFTQDGIFRFFAQQDWGPTGYSFPFFTGGVDPDFTLNTPDSDNNFKYTGATGSRTIHVDMDTKTVQLD